MSIAASKRLWKEYKDIKDPRTGLKNVHVDLDDDNIFLWKIIIIVNNKDSLFNGAFLKGLLKFPTNYPYSPPTFKFTPSIYHPNVYTDGRLCISILHEAGNTTSDEADSETWSPAQSAQSILLSIMSLLDDPNISSPANVDASVSYRKDRENYLKRIQTEIEKSKKAIPDDFEIPDLSEKGTKEEEPMEDEGWWEDDYYDYDDEEDDDDDDDEEEEEEDDDDDDKMSDL